MEACLVNLLEPGDKAVVCVNGVFGTRMADIVERCGAALVRGRGAVGPGHRSRPTSSARCSAQPPPSWSRIVHAETSTGAWQPLEEIGRLVRDAGALFVVDAVTSLGGCPLRVDDWGIDACYSGTQKCLSCPPGLSPVTFGPRAVEALQRAQDQGAELVPRPDA